MKTCLAFLFFFVIALGFSQNNYIVKTDDGRRVLLKADYTWEYIDAEVTENSIAIAVKEEKYRCSIGKGFVEPKLNKKIQLQLKKGRATIMHVKRKVAKDYKCDEEDVILISVKEQKERAVYNFCVKGEKVRYKRVGNTILKPIIVL